MNYRIIRAFFKTLINYENLPNLTALDLAKVNRELIVNGMINENQSTVAVHQNRTKAITKISELRVPYED